MTLADCLLHFASRCILGLKKRFSPPILQGLFEKSSLLSLLLGRAITEIEGLFQERVLTSVVPLRMRGGRFGWQRPYNKCSKPYTGHALGFYACVHPRHWNKPRNCDTFIFFPIRLVSLLFNSVPNTFLIFHKKASRSSISWQWKWLKSQMIDIV